MARPSSTICDKKKPVCGQCALSKTECPGAFLSTTTTTLARSGKRQKNYSSSVSISSSGSGKSDDQGTIIKSAQFVALKHLYERFSLHARAKDHVADVASSHFIANFVLVPRPGALASSLGYFEFVSGLMGGNGARDASPPEHFRFAYDACALASLHNRFGPWPELEHIMNATYRKALQATRAALQDPGAALQDHTLGSVILLGYFEQLTASAMNMISWSSHIRGSIELVRRRGAAQLKTKVGLDLFIAVRTRMIIDSLRTGLPIPSGIDWWIDDQDGYGPGWHFHYLASKTSEIKAEANRLFTPLSSSSDEAITGASNSSSTKALREMIQKCKAHESTIVQALHDLPPALGRETIGWASNRDPKTDWTEVTAFPGPIDVYRDIFVADLWNVMGMMRLLLGSIMIRCTALLVAPTDYRTTTEYKLIMKTSMTVIDHIIASVPFSLGHVTTTTDATDAPSVTSPAAESNQQCLGGFIMLYPLMSIYVQDYLTNAQRDWVAGRLKHISNRMGIRFGAMLCQLKLRDPSFFIIRDSIMRNAWRLQNTLALQQQQSQPATSSSALALASASASASASVVKGSSSSTSSSISSSALLDAQLAAMRKQVATRKMTTFKDHDPGDWAVAAWLSLSGLQ